VVYIDSRTAGQDTATMAALAGDGWMHGVPKLPSAGPTPCDLSTSDNGVRAPLTRTQFTPLQYPYQLPSLALEYCPRFGFLLSAERLGVRRQVLYDVVDHSPALSLKAGRQKQHRHHRRRFRGQPLGRRWAAHVHLSEFKQTRFER
jgi:hypothetical protein